MFAAIGTLEPPIVDRETAVLLERDKTWHEQRLRIVEDRIRDRLGELSVNWVMPTGSIRRSAPVTF
jgi:glutathione S-transferase